MKTIYLLSLLLLFKCLLLNAQQPCGCIYRTASDFQEKRISIPADCKYGKKAVVIVDFFLRPYVHIKNNLGKLKIHKDSIYAVQDCKGNIYRIFKQKDFLLLDTGRLHIYSYSYNGTVKKRYSRGIRFVHKQLTGYYFSENDTSEIIPLTLTNVRLALLTNKELDRQLIHTFPNNDSLKIKQGNRFKINLFISDKTGNK